MSIVVTVPTARLAADLGPVPEGVEVLVWEMTGPAPRESIDIVVPPYLTITDAMPFLAGVEVGLIQGQMIGYDNVIDLVPEGVPFANAATVHESATAELTVGLILAAQRDIPLYVRSQDAGEWNRSWTPGLADKRVLLVGFGGVGQAIAARLAPFEVDITVVARTARTVSHPSLGEIDVHAIDEMAALLPLADIVILGIPATDETHHMMNDAALASMPDGALVVNVGRGTLVDTDALVDHLQRGRLRAALDVFEQEPLPAGHPLWGLKNALLSPHVGGAADPMHPRIARVVRTQIERIVAGDEPINVVL